LLLPQSSSTSFVNATDTTMATIDDWPQHHLRSSKFTLSHSPLLLAALNEQWGYL
jgi:hypothetical protein